MHSGVVYGGTSPGLILVLLSAHIKRFCGLQYARFMEAIKLIYVALSDPGSLHV